MAHLLKVNDSFESCMFDNYSLFEGAWNAASTEDSIQSHLWDF